MSDIFLFNANYFLLIAFHFLWFYTYIYEWLRIEFHSYIVLYIHVNKKNLDSWSLNLEK